MHGRKHFHRNFARNFFRYFHVHKRGLGAADSAPHGARSFGTAPALSKSIRALAITREQGEALSVLWTGYWILVT